MPENQNEGSQRGSQDMENQRPNEGGGAWTSDKAPSGSGDTSDPRMNEGSNAWSAQTLNEGSASGSQSYTAGGAEGDRAMPSSASSRGNQTGSGAASGQGGGNGQREPQYEPTQGETYTVEDGDTLETIAARFYGSALEFERILQANQDRISNPDLIYPGQELVIPQR